MKQLVLKKFSSDCGHFELQSTSQQPLKNNEVRIAVQYSGVNFADVLAGKGLYRATPKLPCVIGFEVAGTVIETGHDVTNVSVGDKVMCITAFGGYTSELAVDQSRVIQQPFYIKDQQACSLLAQGCTAVYAVEFLANVQTGEVCLVQSITGGVGQILTKLLQQRGCKVIGTTTSANKFDLIKELGAIPVLVTDSTQYASLLSEHCPTVIFDCYGGKYFKAGYKSLKAGGRIVTYGAASRNNDGKGFFSTMKLLFGFGWLFSIGLLANSKSVLGLNMLRVGVENPALFAKVMDKVFDAAKKGLIPENPDQIFPAEEVQKAHQYMDGKQSRGKVLLAWTAHL